MGQIYRDADRVLVWLGNHKAGRRSIFRTLLNFLEMYNKFAAATFGADAIRRGMQTFHASGFFKQVW
jgi:hypothetical protein